MLVCIMKLRCRGPHVMPTPCGVYMILNLEVGDSDVVYTRGAVKAFEQVVWKHVDLI
jgi:hypothetical protein